MDRAIKKKKFPPGRIVLIVLVCAFVFFLTYLVVSRSGSTRLKVDPSRMTISKVEHGEFQEYYPFSRTVVPVKTVYLDVETGGRVEEIFTEEHGQFLAELETMRKKIIEDMANPADRKTALGRLVDDESFAYFVRNGCAQWRTYADELINSMPLSRE